VEPADRRRLVLPESPRRHPVGDSQVHILIFGVKGGKIGDQFRDLLVQTVGEGVAACVMTEAAFSQPGLGSKAF